MRVLLPPSEGKTAPRRGRPLDLSELAFAEKLTAARAQLLAGLESAGTLQGHARGRGASS